VSNLTGTNSSNAGGESVWQHPLDNFYRAKVLTERLFCLVSLITSTKVQILT
jgi:hypothetical protein